MGNKTTLQSKVLKLRLQLEGKQAVSMSSKKDDRSVTRLNRGIYNLPTYKTHPGLPQQSSNSGDTLYLKKDLTKIAVLSSIALIAQLLLLLAQRNGLALRGF